MPLETPVSAVTPSAARGVGLALMWLGAFIVVGTLGFAAWALWGGA